MKHEINTKLKKLFKSKEKIKLLKEKMVLSNFIHNLKQPSVFHKHHSSSFTLWITLVSLLLVNGINCQGKC